MRQGRTPVDDGASPKVKMSHEWDIQVVMTHVLEVFRCTVPRISAPTTPHGGGLETHQARMINQRDCRVHGRVDSERDLRKDRESDREHS
jgi:hypothetical protein